MLLWVLYVLAITLVTAGVYFSRLWSDGGKTWALATALLLFWSASPLWFPIIRLEPQVSRSAVTWDVLGVVAGALLGFWAFREPPTATRLVGLVLCVVGIVLVNWGE